MAGIDGHQWCRRKAVATARRAAAMSFAPRSAPGSWKTRYSSDDGRRENVIRSIWRKPACAGLDPDADSLAFRMRAGIQPARQSGYHAPLHLHPRLPGQRSNRPAGLARLHPHAQRRYHRAVRSCPGRNGRRDQRFQRYQQCGSRLTVSLDSPQDQQGRNCAQRGWRVRQLRPARRSRRASRNQVNARTPPTATAPKAMAPRRRQCVVGNDFIIRKQQKRTRIRPAMSLAPPRNVASMPTTSATGYRAGGSRHRRCPAPKSFPACSDC